ncbi:hypothetical protein BV25DRAFT_1988377 [Artomyces pyxidatus]|uniref:Uncharacterized protein n=1 Tax=Artomyces pyxidatus TaxID=48021 RepID=A0ACB8TE07_9AGAM|nr:hypothetical protein BV25DRAFT_1988377 [Artomyces pyxidatus]
MNFASHPSTTADQSRDNIPKQFTSHPAPTAVNTASFAHGTGYTSAYPGANAPAFEANPRAMPSDRPTYDMHPSVHSAAHEYQPAIERNGYREDTSRRTEYREDISRRTDGYMPMPMPELAHTERRSGAVAGGYRPWYDAMQPPWHSDVNGATYPRPDGGAQRVVEHRAMAAQYTGDGRYGSSEYAAPHTNGNDVGAGQHNRIAQHTVESDAARQGVHTVHTTSHGYLAPVDPGIGINGHVRDTHRRANTWMPVAEPTPPGMDAVASVYAARPRPAQIAVPSTLHNRAGAVTHLGPEAATHLVHDARVQHLPSDEYHVPASAGSQAAAHDIGEGGYAVASSSGIGKCSDSDLDGVNC